MITHTEIIARAIRQIDAEIEDWREKTQDLPENMFRQVTGDLVTKREELLTLYQIETGTPYN